MPARKQRAASWAACKRAIADWPRPGVIELLHELYQLSDDNRRFLHARLLDHLADYNREDARRELKKLLATRNVFANRFRHGDAKRVIDRYHKATGDDAGVAALLVADLDLSLKTFAEVGNDPMIVDHAYASMQRLHQVLETLAPDVARSVVVDLGSVASRWSGEFGYGLSDELDGLAAEWQDRLGMGNE